MIVAGVDLLTNRNSPAEHPARLFPFGVFFISLGYGAYCVHTCAMQGVALRNPGTAAKVLNIKPGKRNRPAKTVLPARGPMK
jgi:hypothetical protein